MVSGKLKKKKDNVTSTSSICYWNIAKWLFLEMALLFFIIKITYYLLFQIIVTFEGKCCLAYQCKNFTSPCGSTNICEFTGFDYFWCPFEPLGGEPQTKMLERFGAVVSIESRVGQQALRCYNRLTDSLHCLLKTVLISNKHKPKKGVCGCYVTAGYHFKTLRS